ncbi:MAG: YybS family protein [Steroidobacteraceae bacterium]|nr:YybS family protein [Deltaproteobacteria bacterium]
MIGSFVLFAAYLVVPPIGIFSGILAPFPAAYTRLMHGRMPACIVLLGATTATTALFGIFAGCLYLGMCGIIGLFMPELLARSFSGSRTMFWTTAANLAVLFVGIFLYSASVEVSLQQLISAEITSSMTQAAAIYEKSGIKGDDLELVKQSMKTVSDLLLRLYPALVTVLLVLMAGCNLALLKKTSSVAVTNLNIGEFVSFKNPDMLVWVLIAVGFSMLLPSPIMTTAALNILLLVSLLYFVQGLAVVSVLISKQSISGILRIGLYVMLVIQPYLVVIIAVIGLCDLWVDFRTPKKQENL